MGSVPAAQYLRMSTEHQQYSIENQAHFIAAYASLHGFSVVESYADAGKSGLALKHREGLGQLLRDVEGEPQAYRAILVYDVSRWGRFQDSPSSPSRGLASITHQVFQKRPATGPRRASNDLGAP